MIQAQRSANPRRGRPKRFWVAIAILVGVFAALFLGSLLNVALLGFRSGFVGILDIAAILLVALVGFGTYLLILAFDREPHRRDRHLVRAVIVLGVALFLLLFLVDFLLAGLNIVAFLVCLPPTGIAIWLVRALDNNEKEPWRLVMVAVLWGAVIAFNLAVVLEGLYGALVNSGLIPGPGEGLSSAFMAGAIEEGAKGTALLVIWWWMRDEFDGVLDGIVYGAIVGLGFNFMESLEYISSGGGGQFFLRQMLGLFLGHSTYTALIGAGLGVARQLPDRRGRIMVIASGFLAAIGAHFLWDAQSILVPHSVDPNYALLELPGQYLVVNGPWVIALAVLFLAGKRVESRALMRQLTLEAADGSGAVLTIEVPTLIDPGRRFEARMRMLAHRGWRGYRWLRRLQRAQLELAIERWHRERQELDEPFEAEQHLRDTVIALRTAPTPPPPRR